MSSSSFSFSKSSLSFSVCPSSSDDVSTSAQAQPLEAKAKEVRNLDGLEMVLSEKDGMLDTLSRPLTAKMSISKKKGKEEIGVLEVSENIDQKSIDSHDEKQMIASIFGVEEIGSERNSSFEKAINEIAGVIEKKAKEEIEKTSEEKTRVERLQSDEDGLYKYFIEKIRRKNYLIVSYIFNFCFKNKERRAIFANKHNKDDSNNTPLHYAAEVGSDEGCIVLFDRRKEFGSVESKTSGARHPKVRFVVENDQKETAFDICCRKGKLTMFNIFWHGRNVSKPKGSHNPFAKGKKSLQIACQNSHSIIVKKMLTHKNAIPKFIGHTIDGALRNDFGEDVMEVFKVQFYKRDSSNKKKPLDLEESHEKIKRVKHKSKIS